MGLAGRVAVVTGAGQGIGYAIARALAGAGAVVVLNDLAEDTVKRAARELETGGAAAVGVAADVGTAEGAERLIGRAVERFGGVDILVNNVGISRAGLLAEASEDDWEVVLRVNLTSVFLCCRAAIPRMAEQGRGRIVNIASRAHLGMPNEAGYSASKGGMVSLTRTMALEYARAGITANCVAPSMIDTPLFRQQPPEAQERFIQSIPVGRVGQPDDVAGAVVFFAADEASYVTGQVLYVCGGRSVGAY